MRKSCRQRLHTCNDCLQRTESPGSACAPPYWAMNHTSSKFVAPVIVGNSDGDMVGNATFVGAIVGDSVSMVGKRLKTKQKRGINGKIVYTDG